MKQTIYNEYFQLAGKVRSLRDDFLLIGKNKENERQVRIEMDIVNNFTMLNELLISMGMLIRSGE